jgi:hypothetical protein
MPSLLESYLAEVEAKLKALPAKRRKEEMREMRQHLLSAVEANRELGQSEEEAVETALIQFGSVEEASESIRWAWDRDSRKSRAKGLGSGVAIWTVFSVYEGVTSYPSGTGIWFRYWVVMSLIYASMFGFLEFVQRLPLAGETPLQAPAWLRRHMGTSPGNTLPPSP